ncbi:MAG: anti-sigma factor family protein [Novosphingobium sp.]
MNPAQEERLSAWLDGMLSPDEAAAFEAELAADPALRAEAERWRGNDAFISKALAPLAQEPIDDALLDRLGLLPPAPGPVTIVRTAANDNRSWWHRHALPLGGALAASLALAVFLAPRDAAQSPDGLSLALETTPAGARATLAGGKVIEPTLTVRAADGRWCREYRSADRVGLACRKDGRWTVMAEANGSGPSQSDDIALAAGDNGAGLDSAYRQLGASDPVGPGDEAALIAQKWGGR